MRRLVPLGFFALAVVVNANADVQLISNGDFETGALPPWTVTTSAGSGGSWFTDNTTTTPMAGNPTVGPNTGNWYAVSDQFGPGVNALSQTFVVPLASTGLTLAFDMFINDWSGTFNPANNYLAFGIMNAGSDPVSGSFIYTGTVSGPTAVSGGNPNPYVPYSIDLTGVLTPGNAYILNFQESDNAGPMNVGLDDVSLLSAGTPVPEPGSLGACVFGIVAVSAALRRRRAAL